MTASAIWLNEFYEPIQWISIGTALVIASLSLRSLAMPPSLGRSLRHRLLYPSCGLALAGFVCGAVPYPTGVIIPESGEIVRRQWVLVVEAAGLTLPTAGLLSLLAVSIAELLSTRHRDSAA